MKILVTGCAGFVGFHVVNKLIKNGHTVYGVDSLNTYYSKKLKLDRLKVLRKHKKFTFIKGDLSKKSFVKRIFNLNFKSFVHLAAQAGVRYSITNPEQYLKNNIISFLNILENCKIKKNINLLYASTSSVYGSHKEQKFTETLSANYPIQFYAVTKKTNEMMAQAYFKLYGIYSIGLRFFTIYGPWGRPDMALFKFTKNILEGKKIEIFNHGKHQRDFTYVDDIVDAVFLLVKNFDKIKKNNLYKQPQLLNIASGKPVALTTYINEIEKNLGIKAKRKNVPLQKGDMVNTYASILKIKKMVKYKPKYNIKYGIKKFVEWYKNYYKIKK